MRKLATLGLAGFVAVGLFVMAGAVFANHNPAAIEWETGDCGETTFSAGITTPGGAHAVANMRLVVHADGETQFTNVIPTDGSQVSLTVGPFVGAGGTETIMWRVFGGGERSYDSPSWEGFGGPTFNADVNDYGTANGFGWVVAGPEDPNPFTTWHAFDVEGCAITKEMCKDSGWADFGFSNQGRCIQFANTGMDSR